MFDAEREWPDRLKPEPDNTGGGKKSLLTIL